MLIRKIKNRPADVIEQENAIAQAAQNAANIEYIAMMTDVELGEESAVEPVEETETEEPEQTDEPVEEGDGNEE